MIDLRPFQRRFVRAVESDRYDTLALTLPRGEGKTTLAGYICYRMMTPGDPLFIRRDESKLVAASLRQGRYIFRAMRDFIDEGYDKGHPDYRWADSTTQVMVTHKPTNTKIEVIACNGKTAMGIVGTRRIFCDEPGSWDNITGRLVYDAITTAQGKPDSPLQLIFVGTLAPFGVPGHWWHGLIERGTLGRTYVQALRGDPKKWDNPYEIRRVNPLKWLHAKSRHMLFEKRDEARVDSSEKAQFKSYRMNIPSGDEATMLIEADAFEEALKREVAPRAGRPMVSVDLGYNRAWSAAVAIWSTGRVEAMALAPGIPSIEAQEKRDRVPRATYQKLVDAGLLAVTEGKNVESVEQLLEMILNEWGEPFGIVSDRARFKELVDANESGIPLEARVTMWFEGSYDIRAFRRFLKDGPFSFAPGSVPLLATSLAVTQIKTDNKGNMAMTKSKNNTARDDVAAAGVLAAGACDRYRYFERVEEEAEEIEVLSF